MTPRFLTPVHPAWLRRRNLKYSNIPAVPSLAKRAPQGPPPCLPRRRARGKDLRGADTDPQPRQYRITPRLFGGQPESSLISCAPEPIQVPDLIWGFISPEGTPEVVFHAAPRAALQRFMLSGIGAFGVCIWAIDVIIVRILIGNPFGYVAGHVMNAVGRCTLHEAPGSRSVPKSMGFDHHRTSGLVVRQISVPDNRPTVAQGISELVFAPRITSGLIERYVLPRDSERSCD